MTEIQDLLAQATLLNEQARQLRAKAGVLLLKRRSEKPTGSDWWREAGVSDQQQAEMLCSMGSAEKLTRGEG